MSEVHRIRLRGPWEAVALSRIPSTEPLPEATSINLPCRWRDGGWIGFAGRVLHRRRFGKPTNLGEQTIWLTCAGVEGSVTVRLNGESILERPESGGPFAVEITGRLRDRNELEMLVEAASDAGGVCGEVALEIRTPPTSGG
jgi:hypothetical protein